MKQLSLSLCTLVLLFGCRPAEKNASPADSAADSLRGKTSEAAAANDLFGKIYRDPADLPQLAQYEYAGGQLLSSPGATEEFGISVLHSPGQELLLLEKIVTDTSDKVRYQVLDSVQVKVGDEQRLVFNCSFDAIHDGQLIALVQHEETGDYHTIYKAWRANTRLKKFVPETSVQKISCINEEIDAE